MGRPPCHGFVLGVRSKLWADEPRRGNEQSCRDDSTDRIGDDISEVVPMASRNETLVPLVEDSHDCRDEDHHEENREPRTLGLVPEEKNQSQAEEEMADREVADVLHFVEVWDLS